MSVELKEAYIKISKALRGSERRIFMARLFKALRSGGQMVAERELGWNRRTIRKDARERAATSMPSS